MDLAILQLANRFDGWGIALYCLVTMSIAAGLSLIIGLERELKGEPAGLQTHMILSVGCSLLMTLSVWAIRKADSTMFSEKLNYDTSRIAAAVVSGVGFLGAGAIIKYGISVKGLSTAATLWIAAAVGLACGSGFVLEAIVGTAITLIILVLISALKSTIRKMLPMVSVKVQKGIPIIGKINEVADKNHMVIRDISSDEDEENNIIKIYMSFSTPDILLHDMSYELEEIEGVSEIQVFAKKSL